MSARSHTPVDRSVFRRLALITTVMVIVILTIFTAFFALTVRLPFDDAELNRRLQRLHTLGIAPTLALITTVVIIAHVFVLRLLRPLRELAHGVTRLTGG